MRVPCLNFFERRDLGKLRGPAAAAAATGTSVVSKVCEFILLLSRMQRSCCEFLGFMVAWRVFSYRGAAV